jgi:hypothetical protein
MKIQSLEPSKFKRFELANLNCADKFVRMVLKAIESLGPWPEFLGCSHLSGSQRQATQADECRP